MAVREEIRSYIVRKGWTMKAVHQAMDERQGRQTSYQNFSKKFGGSLRYEDAQAIADILGYEIVWVDKDKK